MELVKDATKKRLQAAAKAYNEATPELQAAILQAGGEGETNTDIAKAIDFAYSADYIGKLISAKLGPRRPGRRPR